MRSRNVWLIASLVLLAACSTAPATAPLAAREAPEAPAGAPTSLPTWTPPLSPTPIPSPTLPLPESLTTQELHERLDPFAEAVGGCALPCYNGLLAGESSTGDILRFYSGLGIGVSDLIPGDYQQFEGGTGHLRAWLTKTTDVLQAEEMGLAPPVVDIYLEGDVAQYLYVKWEYSPPYLTPLLVLAKLGQPDRIDVGLLLARTPPAYMLQLVYTADRVGFLFRGETSGDAARRRICIVDGQVEATYFGAFAPHEVPMEGLANSEYLVPLEEATGLSYDVFAALVSAGECLEIPAERWGLWQEPGP
jgi:hypothetical protein